MDDLGSLWNVCWFTDLRVSTEEIIEADVDDTDIFFSFEQEDPPIDLDKIYIKTLTITQ